MELPFLTLAVLFLAFANGANDNFKGVATLYGSGRASLRTALWWGTLTTLAGSCVALLLGSQLLATFSGRGLVPDSVVAQREFVLAVAVGAAATVLLATRLGFPISTTHALVGGLLGAGCVAAGSALDLARLGGSVALPLLVSPLAALTLTWMLYRILRRTRRTLGIQAESCVCFTEGEAQLAPSHASGVVSSVAVTLPPVSQPTVRVHKSGCSARLTGRVVGLNAQTALDIGHFATAGAVGFARGVNDTPKILALLATGSVTGLQAPLLWVALAMAVGGLLSARRVARTLGHRITEMNDGQGFTATLITATLVLVASRLGMPVSTTHVSTGSLFGLGAVTGTGRPRMIMAILGAWLITLPIAAAIAAAAMALLG